MWFVGCLLVIVAGYAQAKCVPRDYGQGSIVCVCNAHNCEPIGEIIRPNSKSAVVYETTKDGKRFEASQIPFQQKSNSTIDVLVSIPRNAPKTQQQILGFGGAFTDATGINMAKLSLPLQQVILQAYYSSEGLDYNMGRIPMASTDFSTRVYTYDDFQNDFELRNFSLPKEDLVYKIPFIKQAQNLRSETIKLYGSPWTSPGWMKDTGDAAHSGVIIGQPGGKYYKAWAKYFVKFLDAYRAHNIDIWGLTIQNEPHHGFDVPGWFQGLGFNATMERDFVKKDLGPTLEQHNYSNVALMILDDHRGMLPDFADTIYQDPESAKYIAGAGLHWYLDNETSPSVLQAIKDQYPDKFMLGTEACAGWIPEEPDHVSLGNWTRFEQYAHSIMEDLQYSVAGWVDWNLVLDVEGGPNWVNNKVDAMIIVNQTAQEFYQQPMYYAMAHFSKFIPRNSQKSMFKNVGKLELISFKRPDNGTSVIILNTDNQPKRIQLQDIQNGILEISVKPRSMKSVLYY